MKPASYGLQSTVKPIAGFYIISLMIVLLTAPLMLFTPWLDQLDQALERTGIPFATDYITAAKVMAAAPESIPGVLLAVFQPFAPDIAAFIVSLTVFGGAGVWALLRKYRFWAPKIKAGDGTMDWLFATGLMLGISTCTYWLNSLMIPNDQISWSFSLTSLFSLTFWASVLVAMALDGGAVAEETGWRGFLLPLLQAQMSPLRATVVLSILWAVWHIPVKLNIIGESGFSFFCIYFLFFSLRMFLVSVIITYFFNRLGGSTLIAIAIHGLHNDSLGLMGRVTDEAAYMVQMELAMIIPLFVVAGSLILTTNGKLGFKESLRHELTFPEMRRAP